LGVCDCREAVVDGTEEDFSEGLYSFLRRVRQCRESRRQQTAPLTYDNVHIENQLIAAATFEKSYVSVSQFDSLSGNMLFVQ